MVKYALIENQLGNDSEGCLAIVSSQGAANLEDIISYMVAEGTGLTRPQALAYFEKLVQSVEYFISLGHSVTTPLFRVRTSLSGTFTDKNDSFDSSRHQIHVRTTTSTRLRKLENSLKVSKIKLNRLSPSLEILSDVSSGTDNGQLTPGGIAILRGNLLRFEAEDLLQGIFIVPVNNPSSEIRVETYAMVRPSSVFFQVPALSPGEYMIYCKSMSNGWKSLRKGELGIALEVAP